MRDERFPIASGQQIGQAGQERVCAHPDDQSLSAEEAATTALWLQRMIARRVARLTQKRLAERCGA